jgi:hypothetical protein
MQSSIMEDAISRPSFSKMVEAFGRGFFHANSLAKVSMLSPNVVDNRLLRYEHCTKSKGTSMV